MSKEQFVEEFAKKAGWSITEFHQRMAVVSCKCGDLNCRGWRPELRRKPKLEELSLLDPVEG